VFSLLKIWLKPSLSAFASKMLFFCAVCGFAGVPVAIAQPSAVSSSDDNEAGVGQVLWALDPTRGVAIFSDSAGHSVAIQKGQRIANSSVRLMGIFPGYIELMQDDGAEVLSFFLRPGDTLKVGLKEARSSRTTRHLQIVPINDNKLQEDRSLRK